MFILSLFGVSEYAIILTRTFLLFLFIMGQSNTKPHVEKAETFNPNGYLSKVELVSIKCVFNSLKSDFPDNFHCLEPKQFLV